MNPFRRKYNVLVLGSDGMLGYDVFNFLEDHSHKKNTILNKVVGLTGKQCRDIKIHDYRSLRDWLDTSIRFDYVVNCIAYTDTNAIETTDVGRELSYHANVEIPKTLAEVCKNTDMRLIHISTDYVYSEWSGERMFNNWSKTCPKNTYGCHKLLGEMFIRNTMDRTKYSILRTSSLYGMHGNKSFVHKILKKYYAIAKHNALPTKSKKRSDSHNLNLEMVWDSYSVPTSTNILKHSIFQIIRTGNFGTFCACGGLTRICGTGNNRGVTPLEFADAIITTFGELYRYERDEDLFNLKEPYLKGVNMTADDFHPRYSVMNTDIDWECPFYSYHWRDELDKFLRENKIELLDFVENLP